MKDQLNAEELDRMRELFNALKKQYGRDTLLLFKMGEYYESFYEDAVQLKYLFGSNGKRYSIHEDYIADKAELLNEMGYRTQIITEREP